MTNFRAGLGVVLFAVIALPAADEVTFGPNRSFRLEKSSDSFGMRSHGVVERVNGRSKFYPLPQSTFDAYLKLHPDEFGIEELTAKNYERQEVIGPYQVEGDRLWFGKSFYHGEGERGIGAIGYFDARTRHYEMFSPPEIALWEASAILVEKEEVWVGLDHFGEDISTSPGGLARWNKDTHSVHLYPLEFVVLNISRQSASLRLETNGGYALLRNDSLERFAIRTTPSGKNETVPIGKFPPPPTHY